MPESLTVLAMMLEQRSLILFFALVSLNCGVSALSKQSSHWSISQIRLFDWLDGALCVQSAMAAFRGREGVDKQSRMSQYPGVRRLCIAQLPSNADTMHSWGLR